MYQTESRMFDTRTSIWIKTTISSLSPVESAMAPKVKADTKLMAFPAVGRTFVWTTEYPLALSQRLK